jgi:DNA mismatch endonuclease (patch repair protein)
MANEQRDRVVDGLLGQAGWSVIRIWEHEDPDLAVLRIIDAVNGTDQGALGQTIRH